MWPASVCGQPAWLAATQPGRRGPAGTAGVNQQGGWVARTSVARRPQAYCPGRATLAGQGGPRRPTRVAGPPSQCAWGTLLRVARRTVDSRAALDHLVNQGAAAVARRLPPAEASLPWPSTARGAARGALARSPRSRGLAADEGHRGDCRCCSCRRLDCKSHQVGRAQHPRPPARATAPAHPRQPCGRPDDHPPCSASRYRLPTLGDAPRRPDLAEAVRGGATVPTGRRAQRSRRASRIRHRGKRPGGWAALPLAAAGSARLSRRRAAFQSAPKAARLGRGGVAGRPRQGSPPPGRPPSVPRQSTCSSRGRLPAVAAESSLLS